MVAPTCFVITLPSSGSDPSASWELLIWAAADRILWMGVLCLVARDRHAPRPPRLRHLCHYGFFPNPFQSTNDPAARCHPPLSHSYTQYTIKHQGKFALGWKLTNKIADKARPSNACPMWVMKHADPPPTVPKDRRQSSQCRDLKY
jgi:hypothetical protein